MELSLTVRVDHVCSPCGMVGACSMVGFWVTCVSRGLREQLMSRLHGFLEDC